MPPQQGYPQMPQAPVQLPKSKSGLGLILTLVFFILLFIGAAAFAAYAYTSMLDYKDKSDQKSAKAVAIAIKQEDTKKDNEFTEKEKSPYKTYQGPTSYGSVNITYPKTWSAYIEEKDRDNTPVNGYFHPNFVPATNGGTAFALRIEVTNQAYDQVLKTFDSNVKAGKVTVRPFVAKNVPGVTGARVDGEIEREKKGSMILLPLRDKTIKVYAEAQQFVPDFDNIVLANLKFSP